MLLPNTRIKRFTKAFVVEHALVEVVKNFINGGRRARASGMATTFDYWSCHLSGGSFFGKTKKAFSHECPRCRKAALNH